jgi:hypothetical protein
MLPSLSIRPIHAAAYPACLCHSVFPAHGSVLALSCDPFEVVVFCNWIWHMSAIDKTKILSSSERMLQHMPDVSVYLLELKILNIFEFKTW